jgi:hypothetical protein
MGQFMFAESCSAIDRAGVSKVDFAVGCGLSLSISYCFGYQAFPIAENYTPESRLILRDRRRGVRIGFGWGRLISLRRRDCQDTFGHPAVEVLGIGLFRELENVIKVDPVRIRNIHHYRGVIFLLHRWPIFHGPASDHWSVCRRSHASDKPGKWTGFDSIGGRSEIENNRHSRIGCGIVIILQGRHLNSHDIVR